MCVVHPITELYDGDQSTYLFLHLIVIELDNDTGASFPDHSPKVLEEWHHWRLGSDKRGPSTVAIDVGRVDVVGTVNASNSCQFHPVAVVRDKICTSAILDDIHLKSAKFIRSRDLISRI